MVDEKQKENGRVVKFLIIPSLLISFLFTFLFRGSFMIVGILYMVMGLYSLVMFMIPSFSEEVYGMRIKRILLHIIIGVGIGIGFLLLAAISPAFSLLTPTLSLSISQDIRFFIIVILAPVLEESWRSATFGLFGEVYKKWGFWRKNTIQAIVFALIHFVVYGIALQSYEHWVQIWGATIAISASLLAAFLFGLLSGFVMDRFKTITPSVTMHQTANWFMLLKGFVIVN